MLPDKGPEPWPQRVAEGPVGPSWPAQAPGKCVLILVPSEACSRGWGEYMEPLAKGLGPPQERKGGLAERAPQTFQKLDPSGQGLGHPVLPAQQRTWIAFGLSALLQPFIQHKKPLAPFSAP